VRQRLDRILNLFEVPMKPRFQLGQRDVRRVAVVKPLEWEGELGPELVEGQRGQAGPVQHVIRRLEHSRQVVHQRARPVEDDVPNHGGTIKGPRALAKP
jgi:hypothetical protein